MLENIWIVSRCFDYEGIETVAVADNKRTANAILKRLKNGDTQVIEKFPVLHSIKDLNEEKLPWK